MLQRISYLLDRFSCFSVIILLAVLVIVVFAQVLGRYVFHSSIFWSEELSRYVTVWATMLCSSVCLRRGAHMGIRFVHDLLPELLRKYTSLMVYSAIMIFLMIVFANGIKLVDKTWAQLSPTLLMPMGIAYLSVPVGAALMMVQNLALLEKIWRTGGIDNETTD